MNNRYVLRATHPLTRPGLTIETEASEGYAAKVAAKLLDIVCESNWLASAKPPSCTCSGSKAGHDDGCPLSADQHKPTTLIVKGGVTARDRDNIARLLYIWHRFDQGVDTVCAAHEWSHNPLPATAALCQNRAAILLGEQPCPR